MSGSISIKGMTWHLLQVTADVTGTRLHSFLKSRELQVTQLTLPVTPQQVSTRVGAADVAGSFHSASRGNEGWRGRGTYSRSHSWLVTEPGAEGGLGLPG